MKQILLTAFLLMNAVLYGSENILKNASFEEGKAQNGKARILPDWSVRSYSSNIHRIAESGGFDGKRAAVIKTEKEEAGYFSPKQFAVPSGSRIQLKFYYRFKSSSSRAKAAAIITPSDSQGKKMPFGTIKKLDLKPAEEWTASEVKYQLPTKDKNGYKINLRLQLNGPGEVWFDKVELKVIPPEKHLVEFYPSSVNTQKTLYPIKGETSQLLFYVFTNDSPQGRVLELDVPADFPLLGAAPVFTGNKSTAGEITCVEKSGRRYYRIALDKNSVLPIRRAVNDLFTGTALLFDTHKELKPGVLNWKINGIGSGTIKISPVQSTENDLKLPKKFTLYTWYTPILSFIPSDDAVAKHIQSLKKSGISGGSLVPERKALFKNAGFSNYRCTWFATVKKCYTAMLSGNEMTVYFTKMLESMVGSANPTLVWNYEPGLPEYYHFCDSCKEAFAKYSGKKLDGVKDAQEAEKLYPAEFMQFRCDQIKEIVSRFAELCRKYNIDPILNSYVFPATDSGMPFFKRRIGNVDSYRHLLKSYSAQVYMVPSLLWDNLENNLKRAPNMIPCFTSDERHNQDTYPYSLLTPEQLYLETVTAALLKSPAIHFFVGVFTFDGRQMLTLRRAMNEIAQWEKFIYDGTVVNNAAQGSSTVSSVRWRAYKYQNQILLAMINPDLNEKANVQLVLNPEMKSFNILETAKARRFIRNSKDIFQSGDKAVFELNPGEVRYILLTPPVPASKNEQNITLADRIPEKKQETLLNKDGFQVTAIGFQSSKPDSIIVKQGNNQATIEVSDGAIVQTGQVQLFRDNLKYPASASWSQDFKGRYSFKSCNVVNGKLEIVFEKALKSIGSGELFLTKKIIFSHNLQAIDALITLKNTGKKAFDAAYWNWNRFDIPTDKLVLERSGSESWSAAGKKNINHYLPVKWTQWIKASGKYYLGWDTGRPEVDGLELEKWYTYTGGKYPTVEQIGYKQTIKPGSSVRIMLHFRRIPAAKPAKKFDPAAGFTIDNPYAVSKKHEYRASLHDHAQYAPTYKHAPVPPADRLRGLQQAKVNPRYKFSVITEHTRITLPENTTPVSKEPQWGVKDILFVPGMEGTIGSWTHGSDYGHFFGEINCVGVSTQYKDVNNQTTYKHAISPVPERFKPEILLGRLLDDGVFVGLCHPNVKVDHNGTHRWGASGYTFDELDILFGNPEKLMSPLPRLPIALEIGNQNGDFNAKTEFKNSEDKWDLLLGRGHRLFGTACDDAHAKQQFAGWVVVYVNEITHKDFMDSMLSGNFYASQGPAFTEIKLKDRDFTVSTDKPAKIEFIGKGGKVLKSLDNAVSGTYRIIGDEIYVRARITRECPEMKNVRGGGIGRRRSAWTNPLYINNKKSQ